MDLGDALDGLDRFLAGYQQAKRSQRPSALELLIICPDCGKNPPFRNRCPKCGGDSWIPAGPVSGIFEWVKARQWRGVVGPPPSPDERPAAPRQDRPAGLDHRQERRRRRRERR